MTQKLPDEFRHLEHLVEEWALPTEKERCDRRHASTLDEVKAFYDLVMPEAEHIAAYLDQFDISKLDAQEKTLLDLACMLIEIAPCIELYGQIRVPNAFEIERYRIHGTGF